MSTPAEIIADLDALLDKRQSSERKLGLEKRVRAALLRPIRHWTPLAKLAILNGLKSGVVCICKLIEAHQITFGEIIEWHAAYEKHGERGLRASSTVSRKRGEAA